MADSIQIAVAGGFSLGMVVAWRVGRALVLKVAGPHARRPILISAVGSGAFLVLIPALMMALLIGQDLGRPGRGGGSGVLIAAGDWGSLFAVALGVAVVVASSLVCGAVASAVCARLIASWRPPE